jgi:hypothetical protein
MSYGVKLRIAAGLALGGAAGYALGFGLAYGTGLDHADPPYDYRGVGYALEALLGVVGLAVGGLVGVSCSSAHYLACCAFGRQAADLEAASTNDQQDQLLQSAELRLL